TISGNAFGAWPDGGTVTLTNTIVADNTTHDCGSHVDSAVASIDTDGTCGVPLTAAAKLGPLGNNGGSTSTQALLPGSPAIDAGVNNPCPPVDQRYAPRSDGHCDIGAFEVQSASDTTPPSLSVPADLTVEATSASGAVVSYTARATDNLDP